MEGLDDLLFVLGCAITDVDGDIALDTSPEQLRRSLDWLLEAARPLLGASERLRAEAQGLRLAAGRQAVRKPGYLGFDDDQAVVLGHPFSAGRRTGLDLAAPMATARSAMKLSAVSPGAVGDELREAGGPANGDGLEGLAHRADLVELDERRVGGLAADPSRIMAGLVTNKSSPTNWMRWPRRAVNFSHPSQSFSPKPSSIDQIG